MNLAVILFSGAVLAVTEVSMSYFINIADLDIISTNTSLFQIITKKNLLLAGVSRALQAKR
jgi:hypothetical protein